LLVDCNFSSCFDAGFVGLHFINAIVMEENKELLNRIELLEKKIEYLQLSIGVLFDLIKTMPQPENLAELGRYLAMIKGWKP
jgi:hypothetical protein